MGNNYCTGAREKMEIKKKASAEKYANMKTSLKEKTEKAKNKANDKYTVAKLIAKGYQFNNFKDNGETKIITEFESNLPICKVALDDFEKRIKEFQEKDKASKITVAELCEVFKDQQYLKELSDENSISRKLFTSKVIMNAQGEANINHVMLVGILLCASTKKMKADVFYNLIKRDGVTHIPKTDILLPELIQKLMEISYSLMIQLHADEAKGHEKTQWVLEDIDAFYKAIYTEDFLQKCYGEEEKITEELFLCKLNKDNTEFLKSYELRKIVFGRVVDHVFKQAKK